MRYLDILVVHRKNESLASHSLNWKKGQKGRKLQRKGRPGSVTAGELKAERNGARRADVQWNPSSGVRALRCGVCFALWGHFG